MSLDPKTPHDSQTQDGSAPTAPGLVTRRKYKHPRLKRLGSVRDLTLGSPMLPFSDGGGGFRRGPPM
jgi:hypothetical protein